MPDEPEPKHACRVALTIPIQLRRITNGEKVIWPTGPDVCEVMIVDDAGDANARLQALLSILDDAESHHRKRRKVKASTGRRSKAR